MKLKEMLSGKTVKRLALSTVALSLMVLASVMPGGGSNPQVAKGADSPRFNIYPITPALPSYDSNAETKGDLPTLLVRNITKGETSYSTTVNASVGDELRFMVYYHNGISGTTAVNTSMRVDFPADTTESTQFNIPAYLWAENVPYNSGNDARGQVTVNLPVAARLAYKTDSSWLSRPADPVTGNYFPDGWHNEPIGDGITRTGINVGNVNGCWNFKGKVFFNATVEGHAVADIAKAVARATDTNPNAYAPSVGTLADPVDRGEDVVFRIYVQNRGTAGADNFSITDNLPHFLSYVPGSTVIQTNAQPNGYNPGDSLFVGTGRLNLPVLNPGEGLYVYYTAKVSNEIHGAVTLRNEARVYIGGVDQGFVVFAEVYAFGPDAGLTIDKGVFNSAGDVVSETTANLLDTVKYRIVVMNTGNTTVNNVVVKDVKPLYHQLISGSVTVEGVASAANDVIVTDSGLSLGNLLPNTRRVIELSFRIYGCPPVGGYPTQNAAYVTAQGFTNIAPGTARVTVNFVAPADPGVN